MPNRIPVQEISDEFQGPVFVINFDSLRMHFAILEIADQPQRPILIKPLNLFPIQQTPIKHPLILQFPTLIKHPPPPVPPPPPKPPLELTHPPVPKLPPPALHTPHQKLPLPLQPAPTPINRAKPIRLPIAATAHEFQPPVFPIDPNVRAIL